MQATHRGVLGKFFLYIFSDIFVDSLSHFALFVFFFLLDFCLFIFICGVWCGVCLYVYLCVYVCMWYVCVCVYVMYSVV